VRAITVDLGRDPKDFALLSLGGAGGLVAVDVARELDIPTVIVPPGQGAFCAFGMLMADVQHDFARTNVMALAQLTPEVTSRAYADMEKDARQRLADEGFTPESSRLVRTLDVRYAGQEHSVTIPFPEAADPIPAIETTFAEVHERQYGHVMPDPVEVTTLRLQGVGLVDKPRLPELPHRTEGRPTAVGTRSVFVNENEPKVQYALYIRENLFAGDVVTGPAVVAEHTATSVIHAGDRLEVGAHGELVIHLGKTEENPS
jgi:N-methylhydantoinase A